MSTRSELRKNGFPALRLAIVSMVLCGLAFPLFVTGLAQVFLPSQANGSMVQYNGRTVGSQLIAQSFTNASLFHPWNSSASGVDPDIALADAMSQVARISSATGIPQADLVGILNRNVERTIWFWGDPYVNVLRVNILLIQTYPKLYKSFQ